MNQSTAIANYNKQRGKHYGIHVANSFSELYHDITMSGTNLSYGAAKEELIARMAYLMIYGGSPGSALPVLDEEHPEEYQTRLRASLAEVGVSDTQPVDDLPEVIEYMELAKNSGTGTAMHEFVNEYEHIFADVLDVEEPDYDYVDERRGVALTTGYLGGAPHIWVVDSPYVTEARECSLCIPGGGDLDSPCRPGEGFDFLCLPPDEYEACDLEQKPHVIRQIDADGRETGAQWKLNAEGTYDEYRIPSLLTARQLDKALQEAMRFVEEYRRLVIAQEIRRYDTERLESIDVNLRRAANLLATVMVGEPQAGAKCLKVQR